MATAEAQLLSRIVRTGELPEVQAWGITTEDFLTSEGKGMWGNLIGYYSARTTQKAVLGPESLKNRFPLFALCDDPHMTLEALCAEVRKARLIVDGKETARQLAETIELDPLMAAAEAQARLTLMQSIGFSKATDVAFLGSFEESLRRYEMQKKGFNFARCSWPWSIMNEMTGGIQEDDYIVFYGRPKSKKSWVLASSIAYFFNMDKRVLIYTKEMTPDNIYKRIAACIIGMPYQEFRMGRLEGNYERDMYTLLDMLRAEGLSERLICLSGKDVATGTDTISWLQSKAEKYKPDVMCVDGLYLLSGETKARSDHERMMSISRAARSMQLSTRIPLLATMQANRFAAKHSNAELDEIAYSDAIGQDATCIIRVINEKSPHYAIPTIALVLAGSREFSLHGFRIGGVPATDFTYKEKLSEKDIEKAKEQDSTKDEPEDPNNLSKPRVAVKKPKKESQDAVESRIDRHLQSVK